MENALKIVLNYLFLLLLWVKSLIAKVIPRRYRYKSIDNEIVLITGGGSGLGRLLAQRLAKLGAIVVLWDINKSDLESSANVIRKLGGAAHTYVCNVSDREAVYKTASQVEKEVGHVTMLINNAGIVAGKRLLELSDEAIIKTFQVNTLAHFWTTRAFLPYMMSANHGHIVTIASVSGLNGAVRLTDYCASKYAVVGFEESLRIELLTDGYDGINSTIVCPFYVNTGMFAGVESGKIPMLKPDYVVDEIVAAILTNEEVLIIPRIFSFLLFWKSIVPACVTVNFCHQIGVTRSMEKFHGRNNLIKTHKNT